MNDDADESDEENRGEEGLGLAQDPGSNEHVYIIEPGTEGVDAIPSVAWVNQPMPITT